MSPAVTGADAVPTTAVTVADDPGASWRQAEVHAKGVAGYSPACGIHAKIYHRHQERKSLRLCKK